MTNESAITVTVTFLPPGVARGAEFAGMIRSNARAAQNNYGRHMRSTRRDNARPGDVATAMQRAKARVAA